MNMRQILNRQMGHRVLSAVLLAAMLASGLSGCVSTSRPVQEWNANWPATEYYTAQYLADRENAQKQSQDEYLTWVKRFYTGWAFYPDGWDWLTTTVLSEIKDQQQRQRLKGKMYELGRNISGEWAKNGDCRLINSKNLLVWADAVKKSVFMSQEEQLADQVGSDVERLLSGDLTAAEIRLNRYFAAAGPEEDPDDEFAFSEDF